MAGRLGGKRVTQVGLVVHDVDAEHGLLLVKGAVPGPKNAIVEVREEKAHAGRCSRRRSSTPPARRRSR